MPQRRVGQRRPTPEAARLLADARASYIQARELQENMPTPLGEYFEYQPNAEAHSSESEQD